MTSDNYPVALFLYRRPETVTRLLTLIADSGVTKIYVFADGPKTLEVKSATNQVKRLVQSFASAHSNLNIIARFSRTNHGLKHSLVTGLNTVFSREHAAIVLEDDTIPHPDFFPFMAQMLTKYRNEDRVMSITGTSIGSYTEASYDFSKYAQCWGWATWKRAWELYDPDLTTLDLSPHWLRKTWSSPVTRWYWRNALKMVKAGQIDTWDYQWSYAHLMRGGLTVTPSVNLVENIGFDGSATHTKVRSSVANMSVSGLSFPLTHPEDIVENIALSQAVEHKFYTTIPALLGMAYYILRSRFGGSCDN